MSAPKVYFYQHLAARTWRFLHRYLDGQGTDFGTAGGLAYFAAEDFLDACFQCCWHIKDWILNDGAIPEATQRAIEAAAHADASLRVIQGYANGTKHLKLRSAKQLAVHEEGVEFRDVEGELTMCVMLYVEQTQESIAADQAIRRAMGAWAAIVEQHGLPFPKEPSRVTRP